MKIEVAVLRARLTGLSPKEAIALDIGVKSSKIYELYRLPQSAAKQMLEEFDNLSTEAKTNVKN